MNIKKIVIMIYFGLAFFCTSIFTLQFILSIIFGGMDLDVDFDGDGDVDLDASGVFSFKGLLHFGIGFSWSMWFARGQENQLLAALISVGIGILTSVLLMVTYWLAMKLKKEIVQEKGKDLLERVSEIYYKSPGKSEWIVFTEINGGRREISVISESEKKYLPGEKVEIIDYREGKYWIP